MTGLQGGGDLDFLKPGTTRYLETLEKFLVRTHNIRGNSHSHKAKKTMAWLKAERIETIKWARNSAELNPLRTSAHLQEQAGGEAVQESREMKHDIKHIWQNEITRKLCKILARRMPNRLQAVINANGGHTKY